MLLARKLLRQMAETRIKKEHPYPWLCGFVQRPLPALPMGRKMGLLRANEDEITEEQRRLKEVRTGKGNGMQEKYLLISTGGMGARLEFS